MSNPARIDQSKEETLKIEKQITLSNKCVTFGENHGHLGSDQQNFKKMIKNGV